MRYARRGTALLICATLAGCGDDATNTDPGQPTQACDAEPAVMTTAAGVDFVRTPESCFDDIDDFSYEPKYVEIEGLRQAYYEAGPADAAPVVLLHGQPSWSYLYRKMIPVLVDGGHRVIAMDHLGMGRSDKPTDITDYTYLGHIDRVERFMQELGLRDVTLFVQDWGSLIGLHVAGDNPDWFAHIVVGNGALPVVPAALGNIQPPVENPDEIDEDLTFVFGALPAQQTPFYDDDCNLVSEDADFDFGEWMEYSMKAAAFRPSQVLEALTWFDIPGSAESAYDAPFPSRIYMAGPRVFPSLINELPGANEEAWNGLTSYEKPFLTIWANNDPGNLGSCAFQNNLIDNVPGAEGQPHTRLPEASHFLQDDQGAEIARRMVQFIEDNPR